MAKIWEMKDGVVTSVLVSTQEGKMAIVPLLNKVSLVETKGLMDALGVVEKYLDFKNAKSYSNDDGMGLGSVVGTVVDISGCRTYYDEAYDEEHKKYEEKFIESTKRTYKKFDSDSIMRKLRSELTDGCKFTFRDIRSILGTTEKSVRYVIRNLLKMNLIMCSKKGVGRSLSIYEFVKDDKVKIKEDLRYKADLFG